MNNKNRRNNRRRNMNFDKPKNFKLAIKRLIKELSNFKLIIIIALILACASSIFSIITPNKLKDLTNEISKGLVINTKNMKELSNKIINNKNMSSIKVDGITINYKDQMYFISNMSKFNKNTNNKKIYEELDKMPKSIREVIKPPMDINKIKSIALFIFILYVFSAIFNYIQSVLMSTASNNFAKKLRGSIVSKINKLPLKYFDKHQNGDIMSRVTNDVDQICQSLNQSLASFISSTTLFLGSIIMMFVTNATMALTAILSSLLGFIFMGLVLRKSQKYFLARQTELGNLNGVIEEAYSGLNIIKTYNAENEVNNKFNNYNKKVYNANRKSQFLVGLMQPMMSFIGNFGYVCVCIVGALLIQKDLITFGVIVAFMSYVRLFTSPLTQIAQSLNMFQSVAASSERVFEFLDEEELPKEKDVKKIDINKIKGKVEFKDVSFRYDGNDKDTIKHFNASIKPGEKIAIVGPTGAGKTTLVNLLMKFYDINKGDILIDDTSIKNISRDDIHRMFTMVLQDTWIFNGTINENIKFNRDISDDKVKEVCKIVGLDHFIKTLPNTYNSIIGDNDSISSGQKQLLTIARAMMENSPFLILDEATSNVDTRTEELVQNAMDKLSKDKTSFIIAHRLSTIKNADLILVIRNGNIVEQGNHEELMKKNGFYADLYNAQFEL